LGNAFGNVTAKFLDVAGPQQGTGRREEIHHGFAVGPGIEYRLTPNIVLGTEYDYINLASKNHQLGGTSALVGSHKLRINPEGLHTITARLSFLFAWPGR
jgi:opacity protein-like surface antigen